MNVNCSTCLELLTASSDVSSAPCGHIFHSHCIIQWLETGKSNCPQCRAKCYEKQLRRIFFTEGVGVTINSQCNVNTLQDKVDSLLFRIKCCETELKTANDARDKAVAQCTAIREEYKDLQRQLSTSKEETVHHISQNRLLLGLKPIADKAKEEAKKLKEKLESYKHIDFIINESTAAVNNRMHQMSDFSKTAKESSIIIVTLKDQLSKNQKELKQTRQESSHKSNKINELRQQVTMLTQHNRSLEVDNEKLSSDLQHNEDEVQLLNVKIKSLQDALSSPSGDAKSSAINRLLTENPAPLNISFQTDNDRTKSETPLKLNGKVVSTNKDLLSPFQIKTKQCGIVGLTKTKSMSETSSHFNKSPCKDSTNSLQMKKSPVRNVTSSQPCMNILKPFSQGTSIYKRTRIDDLKSPSPIAPSHMFYDGLGGHSKNDAFPVAGKKDFKLKPTPYALSKKPKGVSRPKNSKTNSASSRPIDNFFSSLNS